jgi:hypothetical protein
MEISRRGFTLGLLAFSLFNCYPYQSKLEQVISEHGEELARPIDNKINTEKIIHHFYHTHQVNSYDPCLADLLNEVYFQVYSKPISSRAKVAFIPPSEFKEIAGTDYYPAGCFNRRYILIQKKDFLPAARAFLTLAHETGHTTETEHKDEYISTITCLRLSWGIHTNFPDIYQKDPFFWSPYHNPFIQNLQRLFQSRTNSPHDLASRSLLYHLSQGKPLEVIEAYFRSTPLEKLNQEALKYKNSPGLISAAINNFINLELLPSLPRSQKMYLRERLKILEP